MRKRHRLPNINSILAFQYPYTVDCNVSITMAVKNNFKKTGKGVQKNQKNCKKAISRRDVKKTKFRVENLNRDTASLSEIIKLNASTAVKGSARKANTLENRTLQKDWQKDQKIREKSKAEKEEMANNLEKQIEDISGFSL